MTGSAIFWPPILLAASTLFLYVLMFRVRVRLLKSGEAKASDYRTYENEVSESRKWARAIDNQYETPVIFYFVCVAAFAIGAVDMIMMVLAWSYVIIKIVHICIHVGPNRLRWRQPIFTLAMLMLLLMLMWFALHLAGLVA